MMLESKFTTLLLQPPPRLTSPYNTPPITHDFNWKRVFAKLPFVPSLHVIIMKAFSPNPLAATVPATAHIVVYSSLLYAGTGQGRTQFSV